jgi:glycine betaine/proline transport system substrate-binding protein
MVQVLTEEKTHLKRSRTRILSLALVALLGTGALAGCLGDDGDAPGVGNGNGDDPAETITIGIPAGWVGEEMRSYMLEHIITTEYGYDVNLIEDTEPGFIYQAIANGDMDIFVGSWLPVQQSHLDSQPEGSIHRIGNNLPEGEVSFGLAVPQYVYDAGVTSIADLADYPDEFGRTITGVEPGFGMMITADERVHQQGIYGLDGWTVMEGSTNGMLAAYEDAVRNEEWIVVLAWQPHFMYAKWTGDQAMVDLEDPGWETPDWDTMYLYKDMSEGSTVETLVPAGWADEHPELAGLLERFQVSVEDENGLMLKVDEGMSTREAALQYLEDNPDLVQQWLGN